MGFTPEETHYALTFNASGRLSGLEATVREINVDELLDLAELIDKVSTLKGLAVAPAVRNLFKMVGDGLVSWNMTARDETPVPADYDGLVRYPLNICLTIANAWIMAMTVVDAPLLNGSSTGETSLEPSIPMELSSPNHGN